MTFSRQTLCLLTFLVLGTTFSSTIPVSADDFGLTVPATPSLVSSSTSSFPLNSSRSSSSDTFQSDLEWARQHHYKHWRRHVKPSPPMLKVMKPSVQAVVAKAIATPAVIEGVSHPKTVATQQSLDSMTRDGATAAAVSTTGSSQQLNSSDPASMDVGSAVLRAFGALLLVVAVIALLIFYLRKKGYGVGSSNIPLQQGKPASTFGMNPWAVMLAQQAQNSKLNKTSSSPPPFTGLGTDLRILESTPLPGSQITIHKLQAGDRILLIGASTNGTLSVLTEWDIETRPETVQRFDQMLSSMEASERGSVAEAETVRDLGSRLGKTAERLSMIGSRADAGSRRE